MATSFKIQKNGAVSTLASSMTAAATSITVATGTGSKFPAVSGGGYWVTVWSSSIANPLNDTNMEICLVTAISGDTLTVTRSQLGTNSVASFTHASGDTIQLLIQDQNFTDIHTAVNNLENAFPLGYGAWSSYTPTVGAASGTITTASATGQYMQIGKMVFVQFSATITTNGTGAGAVTVSLPVNVSTSGPYQCVGREDGVTGNILQGMFESANTCVIWNSTNGYPAQNGAILRMTGFYQAT